MVMNRVEDYELSAAFFCPQNRAPDEDYLASLYLFLSQNEYGQILLEMPQGLEVVGILKSWATSGKSSQLAAVRLKYTGGAQGYCGGLPLAIAIACAQDEMELVKNTAIVIRVLLGVGAYGEAADDTRGAGSTTLAFRLKYEGQGDDLTRLFPETHVSAITDPRSISIISPAKRLEELFVYT
ncbi:hypothetical protein BELL_0531g00030 [Botrytis elliptica]|uniref:Uncharacterized protein n=1 Tax=Botrytis elliptica TaxID=278938 RepID=A0A4Z1JE19_9HELO|nr:hypothetical protein BELL_0531g00030 [Botrytis elliptica]